MYYNYYLYIYSKLQGLENELRNILIAYASMEDSLGYCQGMNYIAAFILTQVSNDNLKSDDHDYDEKKELSQNQLQGNAYVNDDAKEKTDNDKHEASNKIQSLAFLLFAVCQLNNDTYTDSNLIMLCKNMHMNYCI